MKAITIYPSYAMLICTGAKQYETRTWMTEHRGLLAIHASQFKNWPPREKEKFWFTAIFDHLKSLGFNAPKDLPAGCVIGHVTVTDCLRMNAKLIRTIHMDEYTMGRWQSGNYAWKLECPVLYPEPIEATGRQGLWEFHHHE